MKAALLPERGVVKVAGDDARTFLNGLLTTDVGTVGPSPAGPPELHFELRIDGQSVDPLQWLRKR